MPEENKEVAKEEVLLSPTEVYDVLQFASEMYKGMYGWSNNVLSPEMVNARMKDTNLNPMAGTREQIQKALSSPKENEIELQAFFQNFELVSQPMRRIVAFLSSMLDFGLSFSCTNAEKGDYTSKKYQDDFKIVQSFFDRFDYKKEFQIAVKEMIRNEAFFFSPRLDSNQIVLQELPASPTYSKITGRWDFGLLASLNMYWFLLPGVSLDGYLPFFKQKYYEIWGNGKMPQYDPMLPPELRGQSSWVFWQDLSPDVCWVTKFTPELATRISPMSALMMDFVDQDLMRNLQRNINLSVASRLIVGEIGMIKDSVAKTRDAFSISADKLGQFMALVKSAIGDSAKVVSAPLQNMQSIAFPAENDLYRSFLQTSLASSGVNTDMIFTGEQQRPNVMSVQLSLNTDEQMMENLYPQFEAFLNYNVNKLTKYFKFKFTFEGTKFFNNRQQRFDKQMTLIQNGIVLKNRIASSIGIDPFVFERELAESRETGFVDKLTPILQAAQMSGGGAKPNGRPQSSDSELGDAGAQTRADGGNIDKGTGKI